MTMNLTGFCASFSLWIDWGTLQSLRGLGEGLCCPSHEVVHVGRDTENATPQLGSNNRGETDDGAYI